MELSESQTHDPCQGGHAVKCVPGSPQVVQYSQTDHLEEHLYRVDHNEDDLWQV